MDRTIVKELLIVFCTASIITFGSISAIADDFYNEDYIKSAKYIMQSAEHGNSTLATLVNKAEQEAKGIALEVEIEDENDKPYVKIEILRQREIVQVKASLITGEIFHISQPEFLSSLIERMYSHYQTIKDNKMDLAQAIKQAELKTCSTAYRADIENIDGMLCYQVHLFTPQRTIMVLLDPESGRLLSHRDIERHDDHDDRDDRNHY